MRDQINAFLSNDSSFGRLMTRLGIMIGANLMFVLFSLPLVTLGAAWAALDYVMLKALRGDGEVNPFAQFWIGFRDNFKQATLVWLAALLIAALAVVDVRFLMHMGGSMVKFRYAIYAVLLLLLAELIYLFPLMAAFSNSLPILLRGAFAFALRKPLKPVGRIRRVSGVKRNSLHFASPVAKCRESFMYTPSVLHPALKLIASKLFSVLLVVAVVIYEANSKYSLIHAMP